MKSKLVIIIAIFLASIFAVIANEFFSFCAEQVKLLFSVSITSFSIGVASTIFVYTTSMKKLIKELISATKALSTHLTEKEVEIAMIKAVVYRYRLLSSAISIALASLFISFLCSAWSLFILDIRILNALALSCLFIGLLYLLFFAYILITQLKNLIKSILTLIETEVVHKEKAQ